MTITIKIRLKKPDPDFLVDTITLCFADNSCWVVELGDMCGYDDTIEKLNDEWLFTAVWKNFNCWHGFRSIDGQLLIPQNNEFYHVVSNLNTAPVVIHFDGFVDFRVGYKLESVTITTADKTIVAISEHDQLLKELEEE